MKGLYMKWNLVNESNCDVKVIDDKNILRSYRNEIFNLIQSAYADIGGFAGAKYDYEKEVENEKFKNFVDSLNGAKIKIGFSEYNIVKVMANTMDIDRFYAKRIKLTDAFAKVKAGTWKIVK